MVKPQPFKYLGFILRKFGAIPSTEFGVKNGGSVERIVEELKQQDKFALLISPKGTIINSNWRSGYYYIALELNAFLMAAGLDYEKKCILISKVIQNDKPLKEIEIHLKKKLTYIVPLYPEEEVFEIRKHNENKRSIISSNRLIIMSFAILTPIIFLSFSQ